MQKVTTNFEAPFSLSKVKVKVTLEQATNTQRGVEL
jgi:hypothetical protein